MDRPVAGGQALLDGVFMRTDRAWAIARADGSIEVGRTRPVRFSRIPIVRVYAALGPALSKGLRAMVAGRNKAKGTGRRNRLRLLVAMVVTQVALSYASGQLMGGGEVAWWAGALAQLAMVLAALVIMRLMAPASLWSYHGAEHKAVTAYESGADPSDVDAAMAADRIHPRCGTNIVFVFLILTALPIPGGGLVSLATTLFLFGASVEVLRIAGRSSAWWASLLLSGGRGLQRAITTVEPDRAQQAIGCRALAACIAEHHRSLDVLATATAA